MTNDLTPRRLDEIRARLAAALPGPWTTAGELVWQVDQFGGDPMAGSIHPENVDLIAHAPADLAYLLDEVERLRAAAHRVWELNANEHQRSHDHHHEYKNGYADGIKAAQAAANGDTDE